MWLGLNSKQFKVKMLKHQEIKKLVLKKEENVKLKSNLAIGKLAGLALGN